MAVYTEQEWAQQKDGIEAAFAARQAKWMEKRQTMAWYDQHGREWAAMTQFKNKPFPTWTDTPRPIGWTPPHPELMPPATFFTPMRGNKLRILYAQWRQQLRDAWKERTAHAKLAAKDMYGERAGDAWDEKSPAVLEAVGTWPLHPLFVDAMEAGEPWALGIPREDGTPRPVPAWAAPLVAKLPSVIKAEAAKEAASLFAGSAARFQQTQPGAAFVPDASQYDEVADLTAAPTRRRGRPRKAAADLPDEDVDA